jgi:hypothetical protein
MQWPHRPTLEAVMVWMADIVRHGYVARGLGQRLSHLRRFFESQVPPVAMPAVGSLVWRKWSGIRHGLVKMDPSSPSRATIVGWRWIDVILGALDIRTANDLWAVDIDTCCFVARLLACHDGMLRGCEHRSGLRRSDVTILDNHVTVRVAERWSEKKQKTRPGRDVILPMSRHVRSSGFAIMVFMTRTRTRKNTDILFYGKTFRDDKNFVLALRDILRMANMNGTDVERTTSHSLRAGGATDFFTIGWQLTKIMRQGGWKSAAVLIYYRPTEQHNAIDAQWLAQAIESW